MDCSPPGSSVQGFLRQECWSGFPFPSPRDLPDPGMEPRSPALQADSLPTEPPGDRLVFYSEESERSDFHGILLGPANHGTCCSLPQWEGRDCSISWAGQRGGEGRRVSRRKRNSWAASQGGPVWKERWANGKLKIHSAASSSWHPFFSAASSHTVLSFFHCLFLFSWNGLTMHAFLDTWGMNVAFYKVISFVVSAARKQEWRKLTVSCPRLLTKEARIPSAGRSLRWSNTMWSPAGRFQKWNNEAVITP